MPLYAAHCSPAPAYTRLTPSPAVPSAPCAMNIHDRQAAAHSGRWRRLWCHPYKLCSDLNSQPKRLGDLDLWPLDLESGARVTCDMGYLCANFSLPRPLCSRVMPDVRDRQTDRCQTLWLFFIFIFLILFPFSALTPLGWPIGMTSVGCEFGRYRIWPQHWSSLKAVHLKDKAW